MTDTMAQYNGHTGAQQVDGHSTLLTRNSNMGAEKGGLHCSGHVSL